MRWPKSGKNNRVLWRRHFFQPVRDTDQIPAAITRLKQQRASFDSVYGNCADDYRELNVQEGTGSLAELLAFVSQ
ncbi:hypothetical protein Y096_21935 [Salmonella enterica subsp. enterica serovar Tennessee]|nr:hypothetical protein Y096_21935 [Salmonella enterica subsp. enterica serovar Tennessee]